MRFRGLRHRRNPEPAMGVPHGDPNESYHDQRQLLRSFLLSNNWRKDGRCKKWETYKKKFNGDTYRVKFSVYSVTFDRFHEGGGARRSSWEPVRSQRWQNIRGTEDFTFITLEDVPELSNADKEQNDYLDRLGCLV